MADLATPEPAAPIVPPLQPPGSPIAPAQPNVVNVHYPPAPAASVTAPPTLSPEPVIPLPKSSYDALTAAQAELGRFRAERDAEIARINIEKATAEIKAGNAERAIELLRSQAATELASETTKRQQLEEKAKRFALDGTLAQELAAQTLVPGAAEQLTKLFRSEFVVDHEGDTFKVRTPMHQSVGDYIKSQLALPSYAHFKPATTSGGVGAPGASSAAPTPVPGTPLAPAAGYQPSNIGEALVMLAMENRKAAGENPTLSGGSRREADGRVLPNPAQSFGLQAPRMHHA